MSMQSEGKTLRMEVDDDDDDPQKFLASHYKAFKQVTKFVGCKREVDKYLMEDCEGVNEKIFNILDWWISNTRVGDSFATNGFGNWKKRKRKKKLQNHVEDHNNAYNIAQRKCEVLLNQRQSIQTVINKQSDVEKRECRTRLYAYCICFLQWQGLAFCGHDESKDSNIQGNFLELLRFLAKHKEEIDKAVLENALENHQMTSPDIQKEIANATAVETINAIIKDIGDSLFAIIVDESYDMSTKEQLVIALRYVDKLGHVNERFLGITNVNNIATVTLKSAIEEVFNKHSLSISRLRGQGYEGASNMQDDGLDSDQRAEANIIIGLLQTFEFVFDLHLMKAEAKASTIRPGSSEMGLSMTEELRRHDQISDRFERCDQTGGAMGRGLDLGFTGDSSPAWAWRE
ncbi:hypothetical protein SO802_000995 [Lithocarpus litseifolius]|uniref:DUF4371 domain-containing protein n=1 Tax=Lithocarpus litseifolius TaxID=425828 RepID=A0AAW2DYU0_9ROSI